MVLCPESGATIGVIIVKLRSRGGFCDEFQHHCSEKSATIFVLIFIFQRSRAGRTLVFYQAWLLFGFGGRACLLQYFSSRTTWIRTIGIVDVNIECFLYVLLRRVV